MKKLSLVAATVSSLFLSGCVISIGAHAHNDSDLTETKQQLVLNNANDLKNFEVMAGRGSLKIQGDNSITSITVDAVIGSEDGKDYEFTLTKRGNTAVLIAKTDGGMFDNSHAYLDLVVRVPSSINLDVNDGSGEIMIDNLAGDVSVNDGSGSMHVSHVGGTLNINDGSGDIELNDIRKSVTINDGSGNIDVAKVGSSVEINDGSGNVDAFHISGDVRVTDGSGNVHVGDITGNVRVDDSSGNIEVNRVSGNVRISDGSGNINVANAGSLTIHEAGSGNVAINNISGKVSM
jgi:hypothetical protein